MAREAALREASDAHGREREDTSRHEASLRGRISELEGKLRERDAEVARLKARRW